MIGSYKLFLYLSTCCALATGLFSLRPARGRPDPVTIAAEDKLLSILETTDAISGDETKLSSGQLGSIQEAICVLEKSKSGVKDPVMSPLIDGTWKLLYTSSPGTNSPIQRKVTSTKGVAVYQVVNLLSTNGSFLPGLPDISNT